MKELINKHININKVLKSLFIIYIFYNAAIFKLIPIKLFNMDTSNMNNAIILSLYTSICVSIVVFIAYFRDIIKEFKTFKSNLLKNLDIGFKYWITGIAIMFISNLILLLVFKSGGANNENAVQELIKLNPLVMGISACIFAPFNEEFVFRKTFKDIFKNKWIFAIISFLAFGGAHVISAATNIIDLLYIVPYGALGFTFALAYYDSDSVFTSMFYHFLHNTILFLLSILI